MYEVFNYITGETIGYLSSESSAIGYCIMFDHVDYINADGESSIIDDGV